MKSITEIFKELDELEAEHYIKKGYGVYNTSKYYAYIQKSVDGVDIKVDRFRDDPVEAINKCYEKFIDLITAGDKSFLSNNLIEGITKKPEDKMIEQAVEAQDALAEDDEIPF